MSERYWLQMRARWAALTASEQRTLKWGAFIIVPILFYLLLWQPAHGGVVRLQSSVPQMRAQLAQMQSQAVEIQTLRQSAHPAVLEGEVLQRVVAGTAEGAGWSAPQFAVEMADKYQVRINAESIEFARWLRFLHELENTHHIRVAALTVSALPTKGMVKVSAVLSNGAGE